MKLDVYDPTVFVKSLRVTFEVPHVEVSILSQISIDSPFEIPSDNTQFFGMGMTDEIESTYNMLETM